MDKIILKSVLILVYEWYNGANIKTLNNITSDTKNILESLKNEIGDEVIFSKIK